MPRTGLAAALLCAALAAAVAGVEHHGTDFSRHFLFPDEFSSFEADTDLETAHGHLRNIFERLDVGLDEDGEPVGGAGNGAISRGELFVRVMAVEKTTVELETAKLLETLDRNDDLLLDREEVMAYNWAAENISTAAIIARFQVADMNGDGYLPEEELVAMFFPLWRGRMHVLLLHEFFDRNQTENPHAMSKEEFLHSNWTVAPFSTFTDRSVTTFFSLDKDGSGTLDAAELKSWVARQPYKHVEAITSAMFDAADDDRDGMLTVDEFEKHIHFFVGHEVGKGEVGETTEQEAADHVGDKHDVESADSTDSAEDGPAHEEL